MTDVKFVVVFFCLSVAVVHAETSEARHAVSHIQFRRFLELLLLAVGHHAESHVQHVFARDALKLRQRREFPVHPDVRVVADFAVQVRGLGFARHAQKVVNIHPAPI